MLILQNLSYLHPSKSLLLHDIDLTIKDHEKAALVGNNGVGKSTLLKIITGEIPPFNGLVKVDATPYFVPQIFGQYNDLTIAEALGIDQKLAALQHILDGAVTEENLHLLNDDWTIEERCKEALEYWRLTGISLTEKMKSLSGGQKTKVFLAGIAIHQSQFVLLDEPSNHLDVEGRKLLYEFIKSTSCTVLVVSHDRTLLNLLNTVYELNRGVITVYGGNYEFYAAQKLLENNALEEDVKSREKALRKAKEKERETIERQQKLDARGKKKQEKAGVATIMMNTMRNNAEKSTAKLKDVHAEKIGGIANELQALRNQLQTIDKMKFGFDDSALHKGKVLFTASRINHRYSNEWLWGEEFNIEIRSGERIALKGLNGSGKTTLIKIILGSIEAMQGDVHRASNYAIYVDQDYSLIDNNLTVYEQASVFNTSALQEHEIKIRLSRFLFGKEDWDKKCAVLSGGEKMRLMLCCLTIGSKSPDIIILDEPTNNLDIQNIEILTSAVQQYQGTLIVVSHDEYFLERIQVGRTINL